MQAVFELSYVWQTQFYIFKSVFHDLHMRQPVLRMDSTDSILAQMGWVDADQETEHCNGNGSNEFWWQLQTPRHRPDATYVMKRTVDYPAKGYGIKVSDHQCPSTSKAATPEFHLDIDAFHVVWQWMYRRPLAYIKWFHQESILSDTWFYMLFCMIAGFRTVLHIINSILVQCGLCIFNMLIIVQKFVIAGV